MVKTCFQCHEEKPISEFHVHRMMADGHLNKCKVCVRECVAERVRRLSNDPEWALKERKRHRTKSEKYRMEGRYNPPTGKKKSEYVKRYQSSHSERRKAHVIVGNAIRACKLIKMPCVKCGKKAEAHHEDYSKPLDVIWFCKKHHSERHNEIRDLELITKLNP